MSLSWQRASGAVIDGRGFRPGLFAFAKAIKVFALIAIAGALFWIVWVYGNGLRDPRYLDGWILAVGFIAQLCFHIAIKSGRLSPRLSARWRKTHIFIGYVLIAAFVSHSDFSLPDTAFEWALWIGFVLISLSGVIGAYISWSIKTQQRVQPGLTYAGVAARREELARQAQILVTEFDQPAANIGLPGLPHDAWIADLYAKSLRDFFDAPRNASGHLIRSRHQSKLLTTEIDGLSRYVDKQGQDKLASLKLLVLEKDDLDYARVHLWLGQFWLFVHVPATYALIVLVIFHVLVAYAFSSGAW